MASPKQDPTSHALLLAETLELQQTLVGVHAQLQANVVILSKQVQSGLGAVARVLDILAKEKGAVGSGPEVRDKEREKVENEVILAKGRAAAAIAAAAAVKAMTSTSPSTAPAFDFTSGLKNTSRSISFGEQAPHSQPDRYQYHNDLLDLIRDPLSPPKKNSSALSPSGGMPLSPIPSYNNQQMTFQSVPPQPITKQSSSSAKISMSDHSSAGVQSDTHLSMGLKWESTDYVMASKLEARNQQLSKNSSVFSDSSLGNPEYSKRSGRVCNCHSIKHTSTTKEKWWITAPTSTIQYSHSYQLQT
ncbi:hypothetical protein BDR26DRAFT_900047 [Obelidium mucronatum]|nr:hypothetical protein BDR26DRAFT_900047 [Obelidium mucronatum]